jgi:molybdopterin molybdotransferase
VLEENVQTLKNIEADAAAEMLSALPVALETETVSLPEALHRLLAEDVFAALPAPPFDRSPFDGYAFRGSDTQGASKQNPVVLKITEEIPAGKVPTMAVTEGFAAKILTGAPIPEGADATIKYENTSYTDTTVTIYEPVLPNSDIVRAGDDCKVGELLAPRGTHVEAPLLGVLASQGIVSLRVVKKPVVTVINTGSELVEIGSPLPTGMIYNSNVHTLCGYLRDMGAEPRNGGVVMDEPGVIARRIQEALDVSDLVITTGGASVGDYDWAVTASQMLGASVLFWKINMKPGGAIIAAVKDGKVILSLSGNPGAAVLGLLRIALPYIKKRCGHTVLETPVVRVALKEPLTKASPKLRLVRGRLEIQDGTAYFAENEGQGNGAVSSLVGCDLLGEIEAGSPPLPAGTLIKAYRL